MKKEITLIAAVILLFAVSGLATDSVTPYLGLTLPTPGESNWNVPVVNNFRTIDAAIEALAGGGGGTGATGPQGPVGAQGPAGPQGPVGPAGGVTWGGAWNSGPTYVQGEGVTSGGVLYVATATSTNVVPPNVSYWFQMTGATGPQGPAGPQGAVGPQGFQGIQGVAGATGSQGVTGATGATGSAGSAGATGAQGAAGLAGYVVQTSCSTFTTTGQLCFQTSNSTMWGYTGSALYQVDASVSIANGKFVFTNASTGVPEAGTAAEINALLGYTPGVSLGIVTPQQFTGATADIQITACLAAGPICDASGYGATTQSIAATVTVPTGKTLIFNPATKYQAATSALNLFVFEPGSVIRGLTFDCTNQPSYSGSVFSNDTASAYFQTNPATIDSITINSSCLGVTTGTALNLTSTSGSYPIYFQNFTNWTVNGLANSALLTGAGNVNGNHFYNWRVNTSANGFHFTTAGGHLDANLFTGSCEGSYLSHTGTYCWDFDGSGTGTAEGNQFEGNMWDYTTSMNFSVSNALYNYAVGNLGGGPGGSYSGSNFVINLVAGPPYSVYSPGYLYRLAGLDIYSGGVVAWNVGGTIDTGISRGAANLLRFGNGTQGNASATLEASVYGWANSGTLDTGLSRDVAAGVVDVGNGTAGDYSGWLRATKVYSLNNEGFAPVVYLSLITCNGGSNGYIQFCSDCKNVLDDSGTVGSQAASGGNGSFVSCVNNKWREMD